MSLAPGARLGHYEIVAPIGAGGMGEVFRARDTRLHRDVAIKVLSDSVTQDSDRLARFAREARSLAALNHPNIAHVYGVDDGSGGDIAHIVMELVEGDDLAARIALGPLPTSEAIAIARQVAEALDAAHQGGIVHRDLKPANIKVRPDGTVKVLDFGLAKTVEAAGGSGRPGAENTITAPTITTPAMTQAGIILGTAAYMSPEQARGRVVDKRSDIWSYGCVLYEMLVGKPAFDGETTTDVLGSIVKLDPDWSKLPSDTPPGVGRLLRRCLQKDANKRLRDIGDAIAELDAEPLTAAGPVAAIASRGRGTPWWIAALLIVAAVAGAIGYFLRTPPTSPARLQKFSIAVQQPGGHIRHPTISPDGRSVAYIASSRIVVQSLDALAPRELAGTEGANRPFWSPDGQWLAYFRAEALLKVPASGGPVVRVASLPAVQAPLGSNSGAWLDDGSLVLSLASGPLLRVSSGGGEPKPFTNIPTTVALDLHDVRAIPGGALLCVLHRPAGLDAIGVLKDGSLRIVIEASNVARPSYAPPGHIVFDRRSPNPGLWAVPFSLDRLDVTGEPFLIGVGNELSVARDGTLAYLAEPEHTVRQIAWFDLDGQVGTRIAEPRDWTEGLAISRDSQTVMAATLDGIWSYDIATGARSRITNGSDITPRWLSDREFVFVRTIDNVPTLMMRPIAAGSPERILATRARFPTVTADGRRIVFNIAQDSGVGGWQIAWIDLERPDEIKRLGGPHLGARFPTVSPDGALVAYISGEMGTDEIFLTQLPSGDGKWQLSREGGGWAHFSPRGDTVFYRAPDLSFFSVPVGRSGTVRVGQPTKIFAWGDAWAPFYDIAPDGKRGMAVVPPSGVAHVARLSIVENWHREFQASR